MIATVSAASAAALVAVGLFGGGVHAATPNTASAKAVLRYLYSQQHADGSVDGTPGETEDTIIGAADNGYDPATLKTSGGVSAYSYLAGLISGGKVTSAGGAAKLILAWMAAGKPSAVDGASLVTKLNASASGGGFLQPNGSWLTTTTFGNGFTQTLAVLADIAAGATLPANATGWLTCAQQSDGGFIDQIDPTGSAPPSKGTCGTSASDTNDTALALQALDAAGVTSANTKALAYLAGAQQANGGFGYDGSSASDPDSDAVVVEGLVAAGQDPAGSAWTKSGKNPLTDLATFETSPGSGVYTFTVGAKPDGFTTFTTTAVPAALALQPYGAAVTFTAGLSPVAAAPTPTPSPTAAPTATPSPTPTASPAAALSPPSTGGSPEAPDHAAGEAVAAAAGIAILGLAATASRGRRRRRDQVR
jgi:hypothetical protein